MRVDEIPVAFTPSGGWTGEMPPPVLANCETPLADGAPDMRGVWQVIEVTADGEVQPNHPSLGGVQRIEQAGDRVTDVGSMASNSSGTTSASPLASIASTDHDARSPTPDSLSRHPDWKA